MSLTPCGAGAEPGGGQQRRGVFVVFEGFPSPGLAGRWEVFAQAGRRSGGYACEVVAREAGLVRSGSALAVHAGQGIADADPGGIDTLVVAGGGGGDMAK